MVRRLAALTAPVLLAVVVLPSPSVVLSDSPPPQAAPVATQPAVGTSVTPPF